MNKILLGNLLLILGVCFSAVGAAGFAEPPEDGSYGAFGLGLVLVVAGGLTLRAAKRVSGADLGHGVAAVGDLQQRIEKIALCVIAIDNEKESLPREEFCQRIDELLAGDYFELGNRHEEYLQLLGFGRFTKVWDGIAVCERLLARAWSMATDDHLEEAREELPLARQAFEGSVQAVEAL